MPTPAELRDAAIGELRAARKAMADPEFLLALEEEPVAVKKDAAAKMLAIELEKLKLENASLAAIKEELKANEAELLDGIKNLKKAQDNLANVAKILTAIGRVLGIVVKVLAVV